METSERRRRILRWGALGACTALAIGLAVSWVVAGALVAPCCQDIGKPPTDWPAVPVSFESQSGAKVAGWSVPADSSKGVLLLLHGIRGSRLSMLQRARLFHAAGYSVLMIDLQAHGESSGENITIGHREKHDVRAAVAFARRLYPDEPIGIVGVSLGGASALLASPLGVNALVLESVYPRIEDAICNRVRVQLGSFSAIPSEILLLQLKWRLGIPPSELCPCEFVPKVNCPIYLISGTEDRHTTPQETQEMFSSAQNPKELWLVDGAAHEDLYRFATSEYEANVVRFLDEYMQNSQ